MTDSYGLGTSRDRISPNEIVAKNFSIARRGFKTEEVNKYLALLASYVDEQHKLIDRISTARAELDIEMQTLRNAPSQKLDIAELTAALGAEAAGILRSATDAASSIRKRATDYAHEITSKVDSDVFARTSALEAEISSKFNEHELAVQRLTLETNDRIASEVEKAGLTARSILSSAREEANEIVIKAKGVRAEVYDEIRNRTEDAKGELRLLEEKKASIFLLLSELQRSMDEMSPLLSRVFTTNDVDQGKVVFNESSTQVTFSKTAPHDSVSPPTSEDLDVNESKLLKFDDLSENVHEEIHEPITVHQSKDVHRKTAVLTINDPADKNITALDSLEIEPEFSEQITDAPDVPSSRIEYEIAQDDQDFSDEASKVQDNIALVHPQTNGVMSFTHSAKNVPDDVVSSANSIAHGDEPEIEEPEIFESELSVDPNESHISNSVSYDKDLDRESKSRASVDGIFARLFSTESSSQDVQVLDSARIEADLGEINATSEAIDEPVVGDQLEPLMQEYKASSQNKEDLIDSVHQSTSTDVFYVGPSTSPSDPYSFGSGVKVETAEETYEPEDLTSAALYLRVFGSTMSQISRRVKRVLQDDQNELLDRLRTTKGKDASALIGPLDHLVIRYLEVLGPFVGVVNSHSRDFYATFINSDHGVAFGITDEPSDEMHLIAKDLSQELAEEVTSRIDRVMIRDASDEDSTLTSHLGAAFRALKADYVETLVKDFVSSLVNTWLLTCTDVKKVRWMRTLTPGCSDCEDNELEGSVDSGSEFPTGSFAPPAHIGCECLLLPEFP